MAGNFIDTNVLVYLASSDAEKANRAEALVAAGGTISVQVLNELSNVARRKMKLTWSETHTFLGSLKALLDVAPTTIEVHETGLRVAERYKLSVYDALIVAAALHADCDVLWSEDMQHGLRVDKRIRVQNPFSD
jgi:predicted nucleic acid-binding protein